MVKLVFNPKNDPTPGISSKTSKYTETNLNPFKSFEQTFESLSITQPEDRLVPQKTSDLVGLENTHYILNKWYTESLSDQLKQPLVIIGPVGCGKTSLVELYCKENSVSNYFIRITDSSKTKKEIMKEIFSFIDYTSTNFFIKDGKSIKKLLVIDEYQNGPNDLLSISDIHNLSLLRSGTPESKKELKGVFDYLDITIPPILIISSDTRGSKLSDLKKSSEVYYINELNIGVIQTWIHSFYKDIHEKDLLKIVKKCKSDKRLLLNILKFYKTKKEVPVDSFIESFYKDDDLNLFQFTENLFDSVDPPDANTIYKNYESDGFLLGSLVQENYLDYSDCIHSIANAAEAMSYGETLFSDTYESNKNFLPEAHCTNALYIPSYFSRSPVKKNKCPLRTNCNNNRFNIYLNNKKIIGKILKDSKKIEIDIFDIFILKKFLNQSLIKSKVLTEHQECFLKNILGTFNSIEKLELIYKHFSEFKESSIKESKTKNFTLKFKEKLNKLNGK